MPKIYNDPNSNLYDNYDKNKKYYKLLAIPERNAQAAEFNELQSMFLDLLRRVGDCVLKDGNVVTGCGIVVKGNRVMIEPGKIYLEGIVHTTEGGEVLIKGQGEEKIGVKIVESIITEADDSDLLDPATGTSNHFHPGAYRVKQVLAFTVDDPEAAHLVTLLNGEIVNLVTERPQLDSITEVLARRTFDESGNYVARGFNIKDAKYATDTEVFFNLESGKAYVRGYEVSRPLDTSFSVKRSTAVKNLIGEGFVVTKENKYRLSRGPVAKITRVFVTFQSTETITRGSTPNTTDNISVDTVLSIVSLKQGETVFTLGKDFQVIGNKVDWSLGGSEPDPGTNYTLVYRYRAVLASNQYKITTIDDVDYLSLSSPNLVMGSDFYVDYDFYLCRKDSIGLDTQGNVVVYEGVPADVSEVVAPVITDSNVLLLGSICVLPNSVDSIIINNTVRVSSMAKIQKAIKRIDDLEFNQSLTDLDNEALEGESLMDMRGVFTDGFVNYNKIDQNLEDTKLALDIESGILTMAFNEFLQTLSVSSSTDNVYGRLGNAYCCPYTETLIFEQPYRTGTMLINPYQVFDPVVSLNINPTTDTWVNTSHVQVSQAITSRVNLATWWPKARNSWSGNEQKYWEELGMSGRVPNNINWGSLTSSRWGSIWSWNGTSYTLTGTSSNNISDNATLYMRQRQINVTSEGFENNEDNIQCTFDGRKVTLTPRNDTAKGTIAGSVRANPQGKVECTFTIPANVPCGTKEVRLYSDKYYGTTSYSANGRDVVIQDVVYRVTYQTRVWDPLAQTFQLDDTCNITSVDVFIAEKDGDFPITVQLRKTLNGYPSTEIMAEKRVSASSFKVDPKGVTATNVKFDTAVLCEKDTQYAIVLLTDSPKIKVHVAKLAEKDDVSGRYMTFNPYTAGVLFSSSNAIAWTAHQDMDLKFRLYRANFQPSGAIQFNQVNTTTADRLMLALDHIQPSGTDLKFEMRVNDGAWQPTYPWVDTFHRENVSKVDIRVSMTSTGFQSPLIVAETGMLAYWYNEKDSCYITKNLEFSEFNNLRIVLDVAKDTGVTYEVYYATDKVGSVWNKLTDFTGEYISEVWECREFRTEVSPSTNLRIKLVMKTDNSAIAPAIRRLRVLAKNV